MPVSSTKRLGHRLGKRYRAVELQMDDLRVPPQRFHALGRHRGREAEEGRTVNVVRCQTESVRDLGRPLPVGGSASRSETLVQDHDHIHGAGGTRRENHIAPRRQRLRDVVTAA